MGAPLAVLLPAVLLPAVCLSPLATSARAEEAPAQAAPTDEARPDNARPKDPAWLAAARAKLPAGRATGRVILLDEDGLRAAVAVFPAHADDPATPGSAFDPGEVLEVVLKREGDGLAVAATSLRPRRADERPRDEMDEEQQALERKLAARRKAEPGIEPCALSGWAMDDGKRGIAVYAAPSDAAKVVGRLAPMHETAESGQGSEAGWRVEFRITGYKAGWFRIAGATPPGAPYGDPPPRSYPKTYSGTGWIRVSQAGGAYANTQMPVQHLLQAPHVDAQDFPPGEGAATPDGNLAIDSALEQLYACSGNWALTKSRDGRRGWWRGICSNQVTTCS